ncbi:MAG: cobalamin-binding protein [Thiomicrorhabdus sp.]|nr:cobalamin-binding protein [Thiomicrorhabdus sp.]
MPQLNATNPLSLYLLYFLIFATPHSAYGTPEIAYQRIISLAPHITEMLYSAGGGEKIVGVVSYSDYPKEALSKPIIGGYNAINLEKIIELNPDLILGWASGNRPQDIKRLKELGFNVQLFEVKTLEDIPYRIEQLGKYGGSPIKAQQTAQALRETLNRVRQTYQHRTPVTSFYQIWHQPIITMNGDQFISQAIAACGATNSYHDLPKLTASIGLESLFERNPQLFLLGGQASFQQDWLTFWQKYSNLQAVKNEQIYLLNNNHYQRPTARLINALESLCQKVDQAREHYQITSKE